MTIYLHYRKNSIKQIFIEKLNHKKLFLLKTLITINLYINSMTKIQSYQNIQSELNQVN